ncbi:hypothetical protein [Corynebacterium uterequi]|uniref:Uncharacterized protein n=1 Tax=Corynebacterium uterequi TaxID=1072256 RepID=A0A0G3HGP7_9CORY|nr:hypothetical protein [Corynebacterium uterequi]AKK11940.1 hypothetical protein CUTER_09860 [Corynebacterium uterequi]
MTGLTLASVADAIRSFPDEFRSRTLTGFFAAEFQARQLFGLHATQAHDGLPEVIAWALERCGIDGHVPSEVLDRLQRLALVNRRFGFAPSAYSSYAEAITTALKDLAYVHFGEVNILPSQMFAATLALDTCARYMQRAAQKADDAGVPAIHHAAVEDVNRISSRLSVVRLRCTPELVYEPGQAIYVTAPYLAGLWHSLTPTTPANLGSSVEFYVDATDGFDAVASLAAARIDEQWILGGAHASLRLDPAATSLTIIAHGTGLAAAHALVFSLVDAARRPQVHLVATAEYPGELINPPSLRALAAHSTWLTLDACVAHDADAWLVPRPGVARTTAAEVGAHHGSAVSTLGRAQLRADQIIVLGAAEKVQATCEELVGAGVAPERITTRDDDFLAR